jgi:hypothetical protein
MALFAHKLGLISAQFCRVSAVESAIPENSTKKNTKKHVFGFGAEGRGAVWHRFQPSREGPGLGRIHLWKTDPLSSCISANRAFFSPPTEIIWENSKGNSAIPGLGRRKTAPKTASNLAPYAGMCRGRTIPSQTRKQRSAYVSGCGVPRREELTKTHQIVRNNILFSYQPPLEGWELDNSWSPAGGNRPNSGVPWKQGETGEIGEIGYTREFPPNQPNSCPRPIPAQFIFGKPTPYLRAFWQTDLIFPRGKGEIALWEGEFPSNRHQTRSIPDANLAHYAGLCRGRTIPSQTRKQRSAHVSEWGIPLGEICPEIDQIVRNNILFSYQPPPPKGLGTQNRPFPCPPGREPRIRGLRRFGGYSGVPPKRGNSGSPGGSNFPLQKQGRKSRFRAPLMQYFGKSADFVKKQQKTAYFPLQTAILGGYPPNSP